jgi:hypothetical protein
MCLNEKYLNIHADKYFYFLFLIRNDLKQGDACYEEKYRKVFSDTRKSPGVEVLGNESKCILLCRQEDPVRNSKTKRPKGSFKLEADLKYLGTTLTN